MSDDLKKIIQHFGVEHQLLKLIEEMSELTKEICHLLQTRDFNGPDFLNFIDELVDVEILIDQINLALKNEMFASVLKAQDIEKLLGIKRKFKIERTLKIIGQKQ